eukprot:6202842-Pleurochrysis_carterae.AAC.5
MCSYDRLVTAEISWRVQAYGAASVSAQVEPKRHPTRLSKQLYSCSSCAISEASASYAASGHPISPVEPSFWLLLQPDAIIVHPENQDETSWRSWSLRSAACNLLEALGQAWARNTRRRTRAEAFSWTWTCAGTNHSAQKRRRATMHKNGRIRRELGADRKRWERVGKGEDSSRRCGRARARTAEERLVDEGRSGGEERGSRRWREHKT